MLNQMISYAFLLLELACGVAIIVRFRGLPRLLGGIAFGVWVATGLTRRVLDLFDVAWWNYDLAFTLPNLAGYGFLLAAFLTGRLVTGDDGMNERTDTTVPPPVNPQLVGIGGWLVLPAIGLVLGPIIGVVMLVLAFGLFSDVAAVGYGGIYALELFVSVGLFVFLIYAATRFFGKKRNAPSTMIALMIANLAASGLLLIIELGAGAEEFALESGKALMRDAIGAAIWIPYFRVSKRVKATFVN